MSFALANLVISIYNCMTLILNVKGDLINRELIIIRPVVSPNRKMKKKRKVFPLKAEIDLFMMPIDEWFLQTFGLPWEFSLF